MLQGLIIQMVAAGGFEPSTHRVWTDCSSQLSYTAILVGGAKGTRTLDPLNANQVLSQLSYSPNSVLLHYQCNENKIHYLFCLINVKCKESAHFLWQVIFSKLSKIKKEWKFIQSFWFLPGRDDRIWTCDLLLPKQTRYQATLRPEMARPTRIELVTFRFVVWHSIQLS